MCVHTTVSAPLDDTDELQTRYSPTPGNNINDNCDKSNTRVPVDDIENEEEFESTTFSSQSGATFVMQNAKVLVFVVFFFLAVANHVVKHPGEWKDRHICYAIPVLSTNLLLLRFLYFTLIVDTPQVESAFCSYQSCCWSSLWSQS